jgi:hypothetical protein
MTQEKLDNQRDVVKNERRQRVDNQPYGTAFEKIGEIMYPKGHPYNWTTIGSLEDLQAATLDDVKAFFRRYYVPNNTVLVLSGDFDEKQAQGWIEKYFGPIAKGADITRPNNPMPKLDKEIRTTVEDSVPLARRWMVWHSVPQYAADEAGARHARLYSVDRPQLTSAEQSDLRKRDGTAGERRKRYERDRRDFPGPGDCTPRASRSMISRKRSTSRSSGSRKSRRLLMK